MVGNIDTVLVKANEIAIEVEKKKKVEEEMKKFQQAQKEKEKDKESGKVSTATETEAIHDDGHHDPARPWSAGLPRPPCTQQMCRDKLKERALERRDAELVKAAAIKAENAKISPEEDDGIRPGWNFPTEEQVHARYAAWEKKFNDEPDILVGMDKFFQEAFERRKKAKALELSE